MKLSVYLGDKRLRISACAEDCGGVPGRVPLSACQLARLLKAGGGDEPLPDDWEDVVEGKVWMPYYACIHSGVTISWRPFSDPWDSVVAGVIYADREEARKTFGLATDEEIIKALCSELETYAQYVEGAVYCTTIYRVPDGADPETVATDECEMLDGVCDQYDYSGFVLPGAKDTLAHYESVTPIQLALFEEA